MTPIYHWSGLVPVIYLLNDDFQTDQSPVTVPRTCEPGPGTLTGTPSASYISGGVLYSKWDGISVARIYAEYPRQSGLAHLCKMVTSIDTSNFNAGVLEGTTVRYAQNDTNTIRGTGQLVNIPATETFPITRAIILRSKGAFYVSNGTLQYISDIFNFTPVRLGVLDTNGNGKFEWVRHAVLGNPWNSDYGVATQRTISPSAGDTITHEADANIWLYWDTTLIQVLAGGNTIYVTTSSSSLVTGKFTYTSASFNNTATIAKILSYSATLLELAIRWTDDSNCWIIRCDKTGSTIKLIQKQAGAETERGTASQTWTGGAISDFVSWPRTLSGAALAEINRWTT